MSPPTALAYTVARYDETGLVHFTRTSEALLDVAEVRGRRVLDVGCGTGIASLLALDRGAAQVVGGDLAEGMLTVGRAKAAARGGDPERIEFRQLDAEALPFPDGSFDVVISGLMLEFATDPQRAVAEMARVLAPGGRLAVTTHGPGYYWEAIEATFRGVGKRRLVGYRPEVWQSTEGEFEALLSAGGLREVQCRRMTWQEEFASPDEAFDFFFATSSGFFLDIFPQGERDRQLARVRRCFARRRVTEITSDIILGTGRV